MTIESAISNIYSYLIQNQNVFDLNFRNKDLIKKINQVNSVITEMPIETQQLIYLAAAAELVSLNFLKEIDTKHFALKSEIWKQPQTVEISGILAEMLSKINNKLAEELKMDHKTNPLRIKENDISFLALYVSEFLKVKEESNG